MSDLLAGQSVIAGADVPLAQPNHAVQFYETDEFLIETVGSFVSEGRTAVETIGAEVQIIVADEGHGIAPDFLPHLFEAFRQAR